VLHDRFDGLASLGEVDQQVAAWRDAPAAVVLLDLAFDAVNAGHDSRPGGVAAIQSTTPAAGWRLRVSDSTFVSSR
jgi:hypothetical protein